MTVDFIEVPIRVANCQGVSEGNPGHELRKSLTVEGHFGLPWLVMLSEVSTADARQVAADFEHWGIVQVGETGSPRAGVALAHDRRHLERRHDVRLRTGSPATSEGGGIRMRPILTERYVARESGLYTRDFDASAIHNPPGRADQAQADYMADVRQTGGWVGGDYNFSVAEMKASTEREYRGIEVLGLIVPSWADASPAYPADVDSDHRAVDVLARIPVRRAA